MFGIERRKPAATFSRPGVYGEFDELLSRFFDEPYFSHTNAQVWTPTCDLSETEDEIRILMDLPGMNKDQIDIQLNESTLVVRGERKFEEQEKVRYHRLERFYGNFTRSFVLPSSVASDKIAATFKDGVLEIKLPKNEAAKTRKISVNS